MNILIVGSEGFIGSHCVAHFTSKGHDVYQADIKPVARKNYKIIQPLNPELDLLFQDPEFDVCINASGSANVEYSFKNPNSDFELNVSNVLKLLMAIRQYSPKCRFINFSSAAVYGNPLQLPINEQTLLNPVSPYGFHKLQSEYLLTEYHKFFGLHTCSLRVFSAYGQGLRKQLFWDLYQKTKAKTSIQLFGTGEESRDFIFIDDLMQALEIIIAKAAFQGEAINVASGIEIRIKDVAKTFYSLLDPEIEFSFSGNKKAGDPDNWKADIRILASIGFESKYTITDGLTKYVEWLRSVEN